MRNWNSALLIVPAIALSGCAILGGGNRAPDEFAVVRNAPLIIPPDYTLTPPVAGTAAASPADAQAQAIEALFGGPAPRSNAETSLLERAGRDRAAVGARSSAGDPNTRVVDKGTVTAQILAAPQSDGRDATVQVPQ
ncbi:MAG TPA: DUF3035 domain-containing protein [Sphingomicrobium sp.]|nr:DUF3035 domain-containing protein [Sphingomicrobium sp.]